MAGKSYRDLDVWREAMDLVVENQMLERAARIGRMLNGPRKSIEEKTPSR